MTKPGEDASSVRITDLEQALEASERKFRALTDTLPVGVYEFDLGGRFVYTNATAAGMFGYTIEEALGRHVSEIISDEDRERSREDIGRILGGGRIVGRRTFFRKDRTKFIGEIHSGPMYEGDRIVGVRGVLLDITLKRKLEEELAKVDKLESLGVLAGGIAHDFNNILTGILGSLSVARQQVEKGTKVERLLDEAEAGCQEARDLTRQLLTFSKGGAPRKKVLSVRPLVERASAFALQGSNVRMEMSTDAAPWPVEVDEGQLRQVVSNIVINAAQAMPNGGKIGIAIENEVLGPEDVPPLPAGRYVRISFGDHGCGIAPEDLHRVFNPYFTTKQEGNGLGLAICFSIVRRHQGHISVISRPGEGSTFTIHLPASASSLPSRSSPPPPAERGRGRILVMDDQQRVRDVTCLMLEELGYEAQASSDGRTALDLYERSALDGRGFDLVLMDLTVMGGMGGLEAARLLKEAHPEARIVVASGYSQDPVLSSPADYGFDGFLVKPYDIDELAAMISRIVRR